MEINNEIFDVNPDEFMDVNSYQTLSIKSKLGEYERIIAFITSLPLKTCAFMDATHGGYMPIKCANTFYVQASYNSLHKSNILKNCKRYNVTLWDIHEPDLIYTETEIECDSIIISRFKGYNISGTDLYVYVPPRFHSIPILIRDNVIYYDNLINLCIMVKDAGEQFEQTLLANIPFIDRWTILDTGSTDCTLSIIDRVLSNIPGKLYQEEFINFKDSRNRLIELAGTECKFNILLDDTYRLEGDIRCFLREVRGDQFADSFSLYIKSYDVEYISNRVLKPAKSLKYIYRMHEVIQPNVNVMIPIESACIYDYNNPYMETRTQDRKLYDLSMLMVDLQETPEDSRHHYYIARTYALLNDFENAYTHFLKKMNHSNPGYIQELIDAIFEAARLANYTLHKPWEECENLYKKAFELDKTRPDSLYFLGIHYLTNDRLKAFEYFKYGFALGYPAHCQYSLKPTLSYHFLPRYLVSLCYEFEDYALGEQVCGYFFKHNQNTADEYQVMVSWYNIFVLLNQPIIKELPSMPKKPYLCIVANGGWSTWTGRDILTKGVGGSETWVIEMARWIQSYSVVVFCNCEVADVFENVCYLPLSHYVSFINNNYVHQCIISRFSEYIPVTIKSNVANIYMILHDLTPCGLVIPLHPKLKRIFCLSEWHVEYFTAIFPQCKEITTHLHYGVNLPGEIAKIPYKFIYSSFPNRGLLPLLQMWPRIYKKQPLATLHIYCDLDGKWVNEVAGDQIAEIRRLLPCENVFMHGWVDKNVLAKAWLTADYWLYPCIFKETFCLTALEAAITKTKVITNGLAALQNTAKHGIVVEGDPMSQVWQDAVISQLFETDPDVELNYEWAKTMSWQNQADKMLQSISFEYKGMYNWTHDLPTGYKQLVENTIQYFNTKQISNPRILEIGTYTGVSLINIVQMIPNSTGIGINEKHESAFHMNVKRANLQDRIHLIKGDSISTLIQMIKDDELFDFIYMDGSQMSLDCYMDLTLAWQVLRTGGILAIDYKENTLDNAVNHFILKNEIKIDRGFIEKL